MSKEPVIKNLKKLLANNYALYLKTQNYHWNVTGASFQSLHALFEEQYNDLFTANDDIAERIRTLGEKVPATFGVFKESSEISDGDENNDSSSMVKELADDQEVVIGILKKLAGFAEENGDEVTLDLAIGRMGVHQKAAWMLRSSI